ncbi:RagB/SusD family nutrient uptake outer membrane protein [Chitinophaga sp. GCM10012297]|uniref:RagB/SusD family nutrient uptake outer membrane protein n=1 Tax=Chitinophaga chungangae TaxID=2821488 RepID=A0ABS3YAI0_9BACT|nr:RagB/SusD family nutrient uptake outer membrane protein [Chitinophaga chungangae]MBO9151343.1 RagB/SusD family nutrient uptake outer membrane protein [Chitinophaga chungangae]
MRKICNLMIFAVLFFTGCKDQLLEESKTNLTLVELYSTPQGLQKAMTGLYILEQRGPRDGAWWDGAEVLSIIGGTDITVANGGPGNGYRTYDPIEMQNGGGVAATIWKYHYSVIGKANEIIFYGEKMAAEHPEVKSIIAEARYFRAHSYFWLFRKYDRIWLNTAPTTPENVNQPRDYRPATPAEVYALLNSDLDYSIENINKDARDPGKVTEVLARHIRADVAMWQQDWSEAITQTEAIFKHTDYALVSLDRLFTGARLDHSEALYVLRSAKGGYDVSTNRMQSHFIPWYDKVCGERSYTNGGWGWGWLYPNDYLFSLYDPAKDQRYAKFYKTEYVVTKVVPGMPPGTQVGDVVKVTEANKSLYYTAFHPTTTKFVDTWTVSSPDDGWSYKDFMVYRLAQTYLFAAEAYMRSGDNVNALKYYNKTWERAGNTAFAGTVSEQLIMDEQARELGLEGHRWFFLKRIGKLLSQVRLHAGEENPYTAENYLLPRTNIKDHNVRWPIPNSELNVMGKEHFPQNPGYNP